MFDGNVEWGHPLPYFSGEDVILFWVCGEDALAQLIDVDCNKFDKK